jgi:hypothetical protein
MSPVQNQTLIISPSPENENTISQIQSAGEQEHKYHQLLICPIFTSPRNGYLNHPLLLLRATKHNIREIYLLFGNYKVFLMHHFMWHSILKTVILHSPDLYIKISKLSCYE